jgi:hypothetical protein
MTVATVEFEVTDVSRQKKVRVTSFPEDSSVGELIQGLQVKMKMPANDVSGRPLTYHAPHEREGRHLNASEKVADVLQTGDRIMLQPNIDAGGLVSW